MNEEDYLAISGIQHFAFCRRQWALIHPYLKEKIAWGLVPYAQALLLSRSLRGDLDGYPPFLWK